MGNAGDTLENPVTGERLVFLRTGEQTGADRPLLRHLTPVLRPLFRWNHRWAIARAVEGLEPYARRALPH